MVKLSPFVKNDKPVYRLVYKICFPDGGIIYRDRIYTGKKFAQHKKTVATEMETATVNRRYTTEDVTYWKNHGLLSESDCSRLGAANSQEKTVEQAIADYIESWDISSQEAKSRKSRLKNIEAIWGPKTRIASLTHQDGIKLRRKLIEENNLSKPSVNKHLQDVKRLFDLALANNTLQVNAMARVQALKISPDEKFQPTAITNIDVAKLLDMARINDRKPRRKVKGERVFLGGFLELFLLFYFGCGLRRSEVLHLDWSMVDLKNKMISLPGAITKNRKPRNIGIGEKLLTELQKIKKASGPVMPQYYPDTITTQIRAFFDACGYKIRLHDARHTFSTILQEQGISKEITSDRLGHSDLEMTAHYTHLIEEGKEFDVVENSLPFMRDDSTEKPN